MSNALIFDFIFDFIHGTILLATTKAMRSIKNPWNGTFLY